MIGLMLIYVVVSVLCLIFWEVVPFLRNECGI